LNHYINQYYEILKVGPGASDDDITRAFKKLAMVYHPDRNPGKREWAHENMTRLNNAYAVIKSYRFENITPEPSEKKKPAQAKRQAQRKSRGPRREEKTGYAAFGDRYMIEPEVLIRSFIKTREEAKDYLYQYFQYNLYNLARRENVTNTGIFNRIVFALRRAYHSIKDLETRTSDPELLEHFSVFRTMIFNFYRASECLNIIDTYNNQYDVDAYRQYRTGDEFLHVAHREIFFDRHNRGAFKSSHAYSHVLKSITIFNNTLQAYPRSTWAVETKIKLDYSESLKEYLELFFNDD